MTGPKKYVDPKTGETISIEQMGDGRIVLKDESKLSNGRKHTDEVVLNLLEPTVPYTRK